MRKILILSLLICFLISCSGSLNVYVKPNTTFSEQTSITVVSEKWDPLSVQGKLEHTLASRGFNVVSEAVAGTKIEFKASSEEVTTESTKATDKKASIEKVQEIPSIFILKFDYKHRMDWPHGNVFENFSATVVDLHNGEIVASVDFSQGGFGSKSITGVLTEFVDELAKKIKRK